MTPLDGGPKDTRPPEVIYSSPDSAQTAVSPSEIVLEFDEYIKAKDMRNLLILSPNIGSMLETEIRGKKLYIRFPDSLQPNTTYSLQLNGSVVDNNEGNVLEDYQLYFSTGDYIDSLTYAARIIDAYTRKACEDCIVALYRNGGDSIMLQERPDYIARTDKQGKIVIPNLAPQDFHALAMQDKNKNLMLDFDEQVSLFKTLRIADSMALDSFYVFPYQRDKASTPALSSDYPGKVHITFTPPIKGQAILIDGSDTLESHLSSDRDSLMALVPLQGRDTIQLVLLRDTLVDSLLYVLTKKSVNKGLSYSWSESSGARVRFPVPGEADPARIHLLQDSVPLAFSHTLTTEFMDLRAKWNLNKPLYIVIEDSFYRDLNGRYSTRDTIAPTLIPSKDALALNLELRSDGSHLIELLEQDVVVHRLLRPAGSHVIPFKDLQPGTYRLRIVRDRNGNGRWDGGDVFRSIPAEELFLSTEIIIRENWDNSLTINY